MLSEACPLQKHSSHYNEIKGNLEEAASLLISPRSFKNIPKPGKMSGGIVFSIPPFCSGALFALSDLLQVLWNNFEEAMENTLVALLF